jgi:hypothetical protein
MRHPIVAAATVLAVAGMSTPAPASAATLYVDPASTDGGCDDGRSTAAAASPLTPWCTLGRAVMAAPDGATVLVRGGSHAMLDVRGVRRRAEPLLVRAAPGEQPSVDGARIADSSHVRLEGLRFTGDIHVRDAENVRIAGNDLLGARIWLTRTRHSIVEGNHVHDLPAGLSGGSIGIRLSGNQDTIVRNNRVERLTEDPIQVADEVRLLVEGNVLRHAHPSGGGEHTDGIQVMGASGLTLRGNEIRDVEHGLMFTDHQASDVTVENNVISDVSAVGMKAEGAYGMPNLRIVNNTWQDTAYGVDLRVPHPGAVVVNNIFDKVSGLADQPTAGHNLVTDDDDGRGIIPGRPRFVDPAAGDYQLVPRSPGIDAGLAAEAPPADRLGRSRWDDPEVGNGGGGWVDIGAYERNLAPPAPAGDQPARPSAGAPGDPRARLPRARRLRATVLPRRRGVVVRFTAPPEARRARAVLQRIRPRGRRKVASKVVRIKARRVLIRLRTRRPLERGRYRVRVAVGRSLAQLGPAAGRTIRVR